MKDGQKRSVGRPRASKQGPTGSPRNAILLAAAELFGQQGFKATTTRQIAERVGIRQPSLFYHFQKKEEILLEIIDDGSAAWLDYLATETQGSESAAVSLYKLMRFDFLQLMTEPYGIGQLLLLPEMRGEVFKKKVDKARNRIISAYRKLIRQGVKGGQFIAGDLTVQSNTVFGMGEALWTWYEPKNSRSPTKTAEQIADLAMRALLQNPGKLDAIKKAAAA